jgi:hypothetical protein
MEHQMSDLSFVVNDPCGGFYLLVATDDEHVSSNDDGPAL